MNKTEIEELADCVTKIAKITDTQDGEIVEALVGIAWSEEDGFKIECAITHKALLKKE